MGKAVHSGPIVQNVLEGSLSKKAGLRKGDRILSINGNSPGDVLDYQYFCAGDKVEVRFERERKEKTVEIKNDYADMGLVFSSSIFDSLKTCQNACHFCFVDQLPEGLRSSLYLKDDDFRLSFLYGNFVTLNNIGEREIERIISQRISPLYISVHSMDPEVRSFLMGDNASMGIERLKRLDEAGISTHLQIVLCPGVNDGEQLDSTLREISKLKSVISVGCVPVSLSKQTGRFRNYTKAEMEAVVEGVSGWQRIFKKEKGSNFVYCADEFYLGCNALLPDEGEYDGYPQYENGIGITRTFLREVEREITDLRREKPMKKRRVLLVTGTLAESTLSGLAQDLSRRFFQSIEVLAVENRLLDKRVGVAGLLPGKDVIDALDGKSFDLALVPDCAVNEGLFIDGVPVSEMKNQFGDAIDIIASDGSTLIDRLSNFI